MITSSRVSPIARCLVVLAVAIVITPTLRAQMPSSSSTTSTPVPGAGHNYLGEIAETVNPANGSVSIRIAATMPPGRGLTLPFSFAYDSNGVNYVSLSPPGGLAWEIPSSTIVSSGGWSESVPVVSANYLAWTATTEGNTHEACFAYVNYVYQDASGNRHDLNLTNFKGNVQDDACTYDTTHWPAGFGGVAVTQAGEGGWSTQPGAQPVGAIIASIPQGNPAGMPVGPVTVTEPDGRTFYFTSVAYNDVNGALASSVEDRNGNIIQITPAGTSGYNYADTLGRAVLQDSGFATSGETVTISGLNAPYNLQWTTLPTPSFQAALTTVSGVCPEYFTHVAWYNTITDAPITGISTLTLPNGKSFSFTYDSTYKVVNKVTYPTGGYVRYVWGMNAQAEYGASHLAQNPQCDALYAVPVITDRYVSFNGSTEVLHQHFVYTTNWNTSGPIYWTSKTTTVTTTDNVRNTSYNTVYTYSPSGAIAPPNTASAPTSWDPVENNVAYYDTSGALLKTVYKTWANPRLLLSQETQYPSGQADETTWSYNSREQQIERDDYDFATGGVGSLLRKTITNYQAFNDTPLYANAPSIVDSPCQVITYDSTGTNRVAETDYFYDNGETSTPCGAAGTPSVARAGGSSLTGHDETNYGAGSTTCTGLACPRGNLTQKTQWLSTGASPVTTYAYDETGQVLSMTDACGNGTCSDMTGTTHTTNYSYADSYTVLSGGSNVSYTPTGTTNAYLTKITDALSHTANFTYDFNTGQLTKSTDANSQSTTYLYNDALARPTQFNYPDGGETTYSYNDSVPSVTTTKALTSSLNIVSTTDFDGFGHKFETILSSDPAGATYTATTYDGNARPNLVYNPTRCSSITTNCDNEGTWGYTTTNYDALGRVKSVVEQDTSAVSTNYTAFPCTTVTDEAGNARQSCVDGLGRMTSVLEDPGSSPHMNYQTLYQYDALNNLINVTQNGSSSGSARIRTFTYDSLSRLLCAGNPEVQIVTCPASATGSFPAGALTYAYDANGNLATKTAPSPNQAPIGNHVTTTYTYDALNRLTGKSYNDSYTSNPATPSVSYGYDGVLLSCPDPVGFAGKSATNGIGRRTAMCFSAGSKSWQYDPMGRISDQNDRFIGLVAPLYQYNIFTNSAGVQSTTTDTEYNYDLNGDLAIVYYPGQGIPTEEFYTTENGAGRIITAGDAINHALTNGTYTPDGQLATAEVCANTCNVSNTYNSRLQPVLISTSTTSGTKILNLTYNFNPGTDNGNVIQIANGKDSNRTQNFVYDPLNRIWQAYTSGPNWGETYSPNTYAAGTAFSPNYPGIDGWGNLAHRSGVTGKTLTEPMMDCPANTNNQLTTCGYGYDPAGNMITSGSITYVYDAENRLIAAGGDSYLYDGDGQRIEKCTEATNAQQVLLPGICAANATGTFYWKQADGTTLAESDLGANWTAAYGMIRGAIASRVDLPANVVHYYFHDQLHSTNIVTGSAGNILNESDYFPYGGEIVITSGDSNRYKFTGKERDPESGLDNFGARYYGSSLGRFMQTDPIWVKADRMLDPQRLNLYSYVRNNPLKLTDPSGMDVVLRTCSGSSTMTQCFSQVQNGLKKEDRSHVHLVEGDGKNGFKKGQYGITVDADYKGSAGNFSTLQKLANDHSATANVDVLKPTDSFNVRISVSYNAKSGLGNLSTSSMTANDFEGYTFFPPGKNSPQPFSADEDTDVVVNNSNDVPATIHHELRHVLLGDFGRMGNNAKHGLPEVEKQTKAAEDEAHQNEKEQ